MTVAEYAAAIGPADQNAAQAALKKWDSVAKPLGSLGLLEDAVVRCCAMARDTGFRPNQKAVAVFCADNGVVDEKVTQTGREVTGIVAKNLCVEATSVCKMAKVAGARVVPVDIGLEQPVEDDHMIDLHCLRCTGNIAKGPAMPPEVAQQLVLAGAKLAEKLAGEGVQLLATGEMGIGNTTTASAVASVLLHKDPALITGAGAGLSAEGVKHKTQVIRQAIALNAPNPEDPMEILARLGGFDIAGMTGLYLGAAASRIPCLIDGVISAAAALLAVRICPNAADFLLASHVSAEPAGALLLQALGLSPLITAGMRLGEGTGAVAAMPLLDMAFAVFHEMSTFSDIKIEAYHRF